MVCLANGKTTFFFLRGEGSDESGESSDMSSVDGCELELKLPRTAEITKEGEIDTDRGRATGVQNERIKWPTKLRLPSACKKDAEIRRGYTIGFKRCG